LHKKSERSKYPQHFNNPSTIRFPMSGAEPSRRLKARNQKGLPMVTPVQLSMLRAVDNGALLPGIDTVTGNTDSAIDLMSIAQIVATGNPAIRYVASSNIFYITQAGAVINGVNFGNSEVYINANNVTIENCTFSSTNNYYSVTQHSNFSGSTIDHCTFTTNGVVNPILGAFIQSANEINITNNSFIDSAGDGIDIGAGVISGNSFTGGGGWNSNGTHPDAIWISNSTGPTTITNNFIDWTNAAGSVVTDNDCIRITSELGSVSDVTVSGNYLIGGSTSIDAGNQGSGTFSNISITGNYLGFATNSGFYPGPQSGVTQSGNDVFDFTNPAYSTDAWNSYISHGIDTNVLMTATSTNPHIFSGSGPATTTLYGGDVAGASLHGGASETILIGGAGSQSFLGGSGKDIFSYLAISDSQNNKSDSIGNFKQGSDVIDLHSINANPLSTSITSFKFIGTSAFSANGGEIRYYQDAVHNVTYIQADLLGDSSADMTIRVGRLFNFTAADFTLTSAQFTAAIAGAIPLAYFSANKSALNAVSGGFSIVDTAANVQGGLAALKGDNAHVDAITLTDSTADAPATISLTTALAKSDAAILAKITSPYVLDTSAVVGQAPITVTGHGANLTIDVVAGDTVVTGGGVNENFYLAANFGTTQITDFAANAYNPATNDTVSLSTTDFANWTTLVSDAYASGAGNANTTFAAADGASLTIAGISLSQFQNPSSQLKSDFTFHA
jgi:hypothetical protein